MNFFFSGFESFSGLNKVGRSLMSVEDKFSLCPSYKDGFIGISSLVSQASIIQHSCSVGFSGLCGSYLLGGVKRTRVRQRTHQGHIFVLWLLVGKFWKHNLFLGFLNLEKSYMTENCDLSVYLKTYFILHQSRRAESVLLKLNEDFLELIKVYNLQYEDESVLELNHFRKVSETFSRQNERIIQKKCQSLLLRTDVGGREYYVFTLFFQIFFVLCSNVCLYACWLYSFLIR